MILTFNISLPKNRLLPGTLMAVSNEGEVLLDPPRACLGLADSAAAVQHGNKDRDPLRPFGDTPLGRYRVTVIPAAQNTHSYGICRRLLLTPFQGPCVEAESNGRRGLEIHEGDENPNYVSWKFLRPTDGCVRVQRETMQASLARIDKHQPAEIWTNITEAA